MTKSQLQQWTDIIVKKEPKTPSKRFKVTVLGRYIGTALSEEQVEYDGWGMQYNDFNPRPEYTPYFKRCSSLHINFSTGKVTNYDENGKVIKPVWDLISIFRFTDIR